MAISMVTTSVTVTKQHLTLADWLMQKMPLPGCWPRPNGETGTASNDAPHSLMAGLATTYDFIVSLL